MGTSLTGTKPKDTYDSLIKVGDNGPISGTAKVLSDGLGNDLPIAVSTSNVGIGTSTPAAKFHVQGAIAGAAPAALLRVGNSGVGNIARIILTDETTADANIVLKGDGVNAANQFIGFGIGASLDTLKITGDSYLRMASGTGGLQFNGDTAAANALDDYEEGTFTPTLTASTSNPTVTYAAFNTGGIYTKIGNKVTASFEVRFNALSGGSGEVRISGLPFTRRTTTQPDGERCVIDAFGVTISGKYLTGTVGSNTTYVGILNINSAGAIVPMDVADLPTAALGLLRGTITYFV